MELESAKCRLEDMVYWNVRESMGESEADRAHCLLKRCVLPDNYFRYGDGHMAPYEWLRTDSGKLLKLDSVGHETDHTMVGTQPWLWDVAGLCVEWNIAEEKTRRIMEGLKNRGMIWDWDHLTYYKIGYAAFRMGQMTLCADALAHDPEDQERTRRSAQYYQAKVNELLRCIG
jgi:hypothetical protein